MSTPKPRVKFLDYDARPNPKTDFYCVRCQKDIKAGSRFRMVHVVDGGTQILHPADEHLYQGGTDDLGLHPVGPECAKIIGREWTHEPGEETIRRAREAATRRSNPPVNSAEAILRSLGNSSPDEQQPKRATPRATGRK